MDRKTPINYILSNWMAREPFIIHTMGKVGSTSVYDSLSKYYFLKNPVYHVHFLDPETLKGLRQEFIDKGMHVPEHIRTGFHIRKMIKKHQDRPIHLISLVRHYKSHLVSGYFQNLERFSHDNPEVLDKQGRPDADKIIALLESRVRQFDENNEYSCRWFDLQVRNPFGLDVYKHAFDVEKGYSIIREGRINLMVFRMEDLDRSFTQAMNEFLGKEVNMGLVKSNVAEKKEHSDVYSRVKREFTIPGDALENIYQSRHFNHFYPDHSDK